MCLNETSIEYFIAGVLFRRAKVKHGNGQTDRALYKKLVAGATKQGVKCHEIDKVNVSPCMA